MVDGRYLDSEKSSLSILILLVLPNFKKTANIIQEKCKQSI